MRAAHTMEQREHARDLREEQSYSFPKISASTKIPTSTLHDWARKEGWKKPDKPVRRRRRLVRAPDERGSRDGSDRAVGASASAASASLERLAGVASAVTSGDAPTASPVDPPVDPLRALLALPEDASVAAFVTMIKSRARRLFDEAPDGRIEKSQVDALWAMVRLVEWLDGQDKQEQEQAARDDELADLIERLNGRVVELARHFAGELAGGRDFTG